MHKLIGGRYAGKLGTRHRILGCRSGRQGPNGRQFYSEGREWWLDWAGPSLFPSDELGGKGGKSSGQYSAISCRRLWPVLLTGGGECSLYTGLGVGFGWGNGQVLKCPTLHHLIFFLFVCKSCLVVEYNVLYTRFLLFPSLFFGSDCECESWEVLEWWWGEKNRLTSEREIERNMLEYI